MKLREHSVVTLHFVSGHKAVRFYVSFLVGGGVSY